MRYKPEHKQATHERILSAAMGLFRHEGLAGSSVERVMRTAGLTVGGFYAHFASKEALLAEAVRKMLRRNGERWLAGLEQLQGTEWLSHFTRRYLNRHMRDNPEGCAIPSVLSEIARGEPELQSALAEGFGSLLEGMEKHLPGRPGVTPRQQAVATLSLLIGALTLARATASQPLSDEVLEAARAFLLRSEESAPPKQ